MFKRRLPRHQLLQYIAANERRIALQRIAGPAAIFAGATGVPPQRAALDQDRALELDAFDRAVAHVALAHRHGRRLAILERPAAPAAAFDALYHEAALGLGMHAEEHDGAA